MKKTSVQSPYSKRVAVPKMVKDEKGNAILLCPFCTPSHPLNPYKPSPCGTTMLLTAEQTVVRAKYDKRFVCAKCRKGGGEMVRFQNGFVHVHDCVPGVASLTIPPAPSKLAKFVYGIKNARLKKFVETFYGRAILSKEVLPDGKETGNVTYFFHKPKKEVSNAKRTETPA